MENTIIYCLIEKIIVMLLKKWLLIGLILKKRLYKVLIWKIRLFIA